MPRAGGASTASGVAYESWAVARELADVLTGINDSVRPQPVSAGAAPGEPLILAIVEDYIVFRKGKRFYHQAKYSAPRGGQWTVIKLAREGVLDQFAKQHREDPEGTLVLTTESDSRFIGELCQRARASESLQEFKQLRMTQELLKEWEKALPHLCWTEEELFALCRKIRLERLSIDEIQRNIARYLGEHFAKPQLLPSVLFDLAVDAARAGRLLDKKAILAWLQDRGIYPITPLSTGDLLEAVRQAGASLREHPHEIAGVHLDRPEVQHIVDWALTEGDDGKLATLLDVAGGGKTVILRDVLVALEEKGVAALAIKADRLSGVGSREALKDALGLPASVEQVMSQLAAGGRAVAILDQLDALSLALSRDQATLDLMLDTIARLRSIPGVRIISSCRTFDLNTDPKLCQINIDLRASLQPLEQNQVSKVLEVAGVDSSRLLPAQLQLLRIPQHLKVFVQLIETRRDHLKESDDELAAAVGGFTSLQDLYGELWRQKVESSLPGTPAVAERIATVNLLVDYMHERRRVAAPEPLLDSYIEAARYLEREDILRRDGNVWVFSHQTLYDYCYARRFIGQGLSLHEEILKGDQGLFVRSEIVQILTYLRGADFEGYLRELESFLFTDDLRFHLWLLTIQWFAGLPDPRAEELPIARGLLDHDQRRWQFLRVLGGSGAWFDLIDENLLDLLLGRDDEQMNREVIAYLESMINVRTERVLKRLRSRLGQSEASDRYVSWCLARLQDWSSPAAVEMLENLLSRGRIERRLRQQCFINVSNSNPHAACHVLRGYLDRRLSDWLATAQDEADAVHRRAEGILPSRNEEYFFWKAVDQLSKSKPGRFLDEFLPWVCEVAGELTSPAKGDIYAQDPLFSWMWYGQYLREGSQLILACRVALQIVAKQDAEYFEAISEELAQSGLYAMHRLLAQGYLAAPETYAEDIYAYLMGDKRRLHLGDLDSTHYDSCQLVRAVSPLLTEQQRLNLESMILSYETQWEKRTRGAWGAGQLQLLKAIPRELLGRKAERRLLELERKFPRVDMERPEGIRGGLVGPSIDKEARELMSDEAWLGAMRKYDDSTEWGAPREEFLKGGVIELSRSLKEHVKDEPERFYELALRFDGTISSRYIGAVISGLAEAEVPCDPLFDLARTFAHRPEAHFRREVCWALNKRAGEDVPNDILEILREYALQDPDPPQDSPDWGPLDAGINSVRGSAVRALCRCGVLKDSPALEVVLRTLEVAADDPTNAVRACVIESLLMCLRYQQERALAIFESAIDGREQLLRCWVTGQFLYYVISKHFHRVRSLIEAMMADSDEATRQAGARLACLAAFAHPGAEDLAESAVCGDTILRQGAAQVYARNLENGRLEGKCLAQLTRMLDDSDDKVREEIGTCFQYMRAEHLFRLRSFIEDFIASPAVSEGAHNLVEYLKPYVAEERSLALRAVEGILTVMGDEVVDIRKAAALMEGDLVQITLAVYTHSNNTEEREHAMDLFERLLAGGSRAALRALEEYDRR